MDGLHAAFLARVTQDAELKFLANGTPLVSVGVMVQDTKAEQPTWIRVGYFDNSEGDTEDLVRQLAKGAELYIEGRLKVRQWQGADGSQRHGLDCRAWKIEVLGRIGRGARSRRRPDGELQQAQEAA
jgi:single-strand DNA-binding protein